MYITCTLTSAPQVLMARSSDPGRKTCHGEGALFLYICIYIYIYIYLHALFISIYLYLYVYLSITISTHTHTHTPISTHTYIHIYIFTCTRSSAPHVPMARSLAFTRSSRLCTNQPYFRPPCPPALPTLVQYYCATIGQYSTPLPTSRLYVIHHTLLVITISCKGQHVANPRP